MVNLPFKSFEHLTRGPNNKQTDRQTREQLLIVNLDVFRLYLTDESTNFVTTIDDDRNNDTPTCSKRSVETPTCSERTVETPTCSERTVETPTCSERSNEMPMCSEAPSCDGFSCHRPPEPQCNIPSCNRAPRHSIDNPTTEITDTNNQEICDHVIRHDTDQVTGTELELQTSFHVWYQTDLSREHSEELLIKQPIGEFLTYLQLCSVCDRKGNILAGTELLKFGRNRNWINILKAGRIWPCLAGFLTGIDIKYK